MMEWTDRFCRAFHRQLSRNALLYTEMVAGAAVVHGDRKKLLGFRDAEHPVACQLGGSDPKELAEAARIVADFGYDEVNLNVGCRRIASNPVALAHASCVSPNSSANACPQ